MGLRTSRGTAATNLTATATTGPVSGIELTSASTPVEFISLALASNVTIAGSISFNVWARQHTAINCALNAIVDRIDNLGAVVSSLGRSTNTAQLAVNATVNSLVTFSFTPTSTAFLKGDRIRIRLFVDDSTANMAFGTVTAAISGPTSAASGDSFVTFTDSLLFQAVPTGTLLYPTSQVGPVVGVADERLMRLVKGDGVVATFVTSTVAGWGAMVQWTATAGGAAIEWYSNPLNAFTLDGLVKVNLRAGESAIAADAGDRIELAITDGDGSNAVVFGANHVVSTSTPGGSGNTTGELSSGELATTGWLAGQPRSVSAGQRLRLRVFLANTAAAPMVAGHTATLWFNGNISNNTGDMYIQLPQTVTEWSAFPVSQFAGQTVTAMQYGSLPVSDFKYGP